MTDPYAIKVKFPYASMVNLSEQYYWLTQQLKVSTGRSSRGTDVVRSPWDEGVSVFIGIGALSVLSSMCDSVAMSLSV